MSKRISKQRKHKLNGEVRFPQVRVTSDIGKGQVMSSYEASKLAESEGMDLILINESVIPPIVRIEEYSKFLYVLEKKEKESKKNQKKSETKEMTLSANIADHDLSVKSKKITEFLKNGNKVKCSLALRGREASIPERGQIVMLKLATLVEEFGIPESMPKLDSNKWIMILRPSKK